MLTYQDIVSEIVLRSLGDFGHQPQGSSHIRAAAEMKLILREICLTGSIPDRFELTFVNVVQLEHLPVSLLLDVDSLTKLSRLSLWHRDAGQGQCIPKFRLFLRHLTVLALRALLLDLDERLYFF